MVDKQRLELDNQLLGRVVHSPPLSYCSQAKILEEMKCIFSLNIDGRIPILKELEEEIGKEDFWNDQQNAQKIISKANQLKEIVNAYNEVYNDFYDITNEYDFNSDD